MNCRKCNNEISESVTMCPFCGTSVRMPESESLPMQGNGSNINIPNSAPIKQMPSNNSSPLMEPIKPINSNLNSNYSNNGSKKSKMSIIISVVGLLVLALIVFVVFRFIIPSVTSDNTEETLVYSIVGDDTNGYLKLPGEWAIFDNDDENPALQYIDSMDCIISLQAINKVNDTINAENLAEEAVERMTDSEEAIDNINSEKTTVANYDAYQVYGHYTDDDIWLIEWFFETGDDNVYYIALEGTEFFEEYFNIPDTFSLTEIE